MTDSDEGLMFSASVRGSAGTVTQFETADRFALLTWLRLYAGPDEDLTVTIEASGPAAHRTWKALAAGAEVMARRTPPAPDTR